MIRKAPHPLLPSRTFMFAKIDWGVVGPFLVGVIVGCSVDHLLTRVLGA